MPTRREFMAVTAGFLSVPAWTAPMEMATVPPLLDHLLLGCNDLDRGIAFVEAHTGVHTTFGGVHPGRGTHNALLSSSSGRSIPFIRPWMPRGLFPILDFEIVTPEPESVEGDRAGWTYGGRHQRR